MNIVECSPSTLYGNTATDCIPTCLRPVVSSEQCDFEVHESCPCGENEVVMYGVCVPRSYCQCTDSDGIISNVNIKL